MRLIKRKKIVNPDYRVGFFSMLFSSGFFTGYFPVASGTFGSAAALLFFLIPSFSNPYILSASIVLSLIIGIVTSSPMIKRYGNDPSVIVLDEFAGMWITMLICGFYAAGYIPFIVGFLMFRLFDIAKVFPASYFDKMKNGFGIMMDDVIAGIYGGFFSIIILMVIDYIK
jgi:phosphatidylglycerophosphatase A